MKLYLMLCACVYQFYKRNNDSMPDTMVFWVTSTLLTMNFWTIYDALSYFLFTDLPDSTKQIYFWPGIIGVINFLIVIRPKKYQELIVPKKFGWKVIAYMICSVVLLGIVGTLHRNRNLG